MNKRIYDIFSQVHAEEALKQKTAGFVLERIQNKKTMGKVAHLSRALALAVLVFAAFAGGFSYSLYTTPSAYIDVDVNPSLELTLNRFGRVIEIISYNNEGQSVLEMANVRNETYTKAMAEIIGLMAARGYFELDGLLSVTVQAATANNENKIIDGLSKTVGHILKEYGADAAAEIFPVSAEVKNNAYEHHVSPAKYLAITELQQVDPTASFSRCRGHSISELRNLAGGQGGGHHAGGAENEYGGTAQGGGKRHGRHH